MRFPDQYMQCAAFLADLEGASGHEEAHYVATGFFVSVDSTVHNAGHYTYFVTAKHVLYGYEKRTLSLIVNEIGGGVKVVPLDSNAWTSHPTDPNADVAVQFIDRTGLDISPIDSAGFHETKDAEGFKKLFLGIGDEVYLLSLFTHAPGTKRNMPMLRQGILAMIPDEPVLIVLNGKTCFAEVFLVEGRSIGGISGAPVFIRQTVTITGPSDNLHGVGKLFMLGLMHGHWDVNERDINNPEFTPTYGPNGVNSGIAIVVPTRKILETLNHPNLSAERRGHDAELLKAILPSPDDGSG